MRYSSGHKAEKRQELLNISSQVAKKSGFSSTGVDTFMKAAGVTSGAFYTHFASKQDLFKALIEFELTRSLTTWENNPHEQLSDWLDFELNRYLSISHVNQPEQGCILPSLAAEIARADDEIKSLYEKELLRGHQLFAQHIGNDAQAWAVMCQLIGTILMARSIEDESIKLMMLSASKQFIKQALKLE